MFTQPPHPYKFGYESVDEFGNTQYRHETSDARNSKRGSYGYTDANGISRRVDYVADEHGFRASVRTNEPGTAESAPADAVYHAKPVVGLGPAVLKAQQNGLLLKDAGSGGSVVPGATTVVIPAPVAKVVAAPEAFVSAPNGGYGTGSAPSALEARKNRDACRKSCGHSGCGRPCCGRYLSRFHPSQRQS
ncbi:hypothetical protein HPB48_007370 [Haemaphysalis longicornis]|uniref:Cuticle protein n=1 Tax=Haemaphysalis longicornis TaxID=44386 RepID=A0A9J6G4V9_HAELO|nr:hypothetical protein HPB48_007370 [Haemaphysalis longicornis]